ncbi:hypothetical protein [Aureimonas sp. SK2]|uniref:hypothetical protein n=1 Tax=Aureimonas sp. SK2 TaxID=3015992 RepID=UPI0024442354|nr:hypothetical protein [Aureimonas sp. SK2]
MSQPLTFTYTNWRGETAERRVIPGAFRFASTEWHPEPQWLLVAFDLDKCERRDFAAKHIVFASVSDAGIREAMTQVIADTSQQPAYWIVTEAETGHAIISTDVEDRAHRLHRQHDGSILTPLYTHPAPAHSAEAELKAEVERLRAVCQRAHYMLAELPTRFRKDSYERGVLQIEVEALRAALKSETPKTRMRR